MTCLSPTARRYLTGRDRGRVEEAAATLGSDGLRVIPEVL
jgi:hypothetical protein